MTAARRSTQPPRSVLILALDTLGDLVLRQPLFTGLLDRGLAVTVVARAGYHAILPFLDARLRVIRTSLNPYRVPGAAEWTELARLRQAIAAVDPDLIASAPYTRSYADDWLLHHFESRPTIGFVDPRQPALVARVWGQTAAAGANTPGALSTPIDCAPETHEFAKQGLLFAAIAGEVMPPGRPAITLTEEARAQAAAALRRLGLTPHTYALGLPAGTVTVPLKEWATEPFLDVADHLARRHGLRLLLSGVEQERAQLDAIVRAGAARGIDVAVWIGDASSMGTLLGLIAASRLYVGNDSGPMHCAGALGVPVVARFGGGHWPRFVPVAARSFVATQAVPCAGCGWLCRYDEPVCMTTVPTATFTGGIDWVLGTAEDAQRIDTGDHLPARAEAVLARPRLHPPRPSDPAAHDDAEPLLENDGWVRRRTRLLVRAREDGLVHLDADATSWPAPQPLSITVSCETKTIARRRVNGPARFPLLFPLPATASDPATVMIETDRCFTLPEAGSGPPRCVSFRLVDSGATTRDAVAGAKLAKQFAALLRFTGWLPATWQRRAFVALAQRFERPVEPEPFADGWGGRRFGLYVRSDAGRRAQFICDSPGWPYAAPARVRLSYEGMLLAAGEMVNTGPLILDFRLPPDAPDPALIVVETSDDFVPAEHSRSPDRRALSIRMLQSHA